MLKYADYLTDSGEATVELCYLRNKQKYEIDFLLVKNKKPWLPIEVKLNENAGVSSNWSFFLSHLSCKQGIQVVKTPGVYKWRVHPNGDILIISADYFLPLLV